jgi:hypothetical protein
LISFVMSPRDSRIPNTEKLYKSITTEFGDHERT